MFVYGSGSFVPLWYFLDFWPAAWVHVIHGKEDPEEANHHCVIEWQEPERASGHWRAEGTDQEGLWREEARWLECIVSDLSLCGWWVVKVTDNRFVLWSHMLLPSFCHVLSPMVITSSTVWFWIWIQPFLISGMVWYQVSDWWFGIIGEQIVVPCTSDTW